MTLGVLAGPRSSMQARASVGRGRELAAGRVVGNDNVDLKFDI